MTKTFIVVFYKKFPIYDSTKLTRSFHRHLKTVLGIFRWCYVIWVGQDYPIDLGIYKKKDRWDLRIVLLLFGVQSVDVISYNK